MRHTIALVLMLASALAQAGVTATINPNPVLPGELFELTVTQSPAGTGEPTLLPLPGGIREIQRQTSQATQIFNGNRRTSRSWAITMVASNPGDYPIRMAPLDGETIAPLTLSVTKPDPSASTNAEVFARFSSSTMQPWVGAEVVLTLRVYIAGELDSGSLPDPAVPGLVIEKLMEKNDGEELIGNQRYRVLERRYVAFPERAGPITIPGPVFSGQLVDRTRRSRFPAFSVPTRRVSAVADDITLDVRPEKPLADAIWIPSQKVRITDSLDIPGGRAEQGQALSRTVRLQISGQLHTQVPELNWPLPPRDKAQSFAEEPQRSTQTEGSGVVAVVVQKFVHIPQGDTLELPAVRLPWFNTDTGKWEQAELPARRIPVESAAVASTGAPPPAPSVNTTESLEKSATSPPATNTDALRWWRALALGSSAGWLLTLIGWGWLARRTDPAAATTASPDAVQSASVRQLHREVLHAAAADDAERTATTVLRWARRSGLLDKSAESLGLIGIANLAQGQALAEQLQRLSAARYGNGQWSGANFAGAFKAFTPPRPAAVKASGELAKLYPDD